jgi:hypothetical protein
VARTPKGGREAQIGQDRCLEGMHGSDALKKKKVAASLITG